MSAKDCDIVGLVVGCIDDREKGPATKTMSACPKLQSDAAELREILSLLREEEHSHPSNLTQRTLARLEQDRLRNLASTPPQETSGWPAWVPSTWRLADLLVGGAIMAIAAVVAFPSVNRAWTSYREAACRQTLATLGMSLNQYAAQHDGRYPDAGSHGYAGSYFVNLRENGFLADDFRTRCGSHDGGSYLSSAEMESLRSVDPSEFRRQARRLGGCYSYSLGHVDAAGRHRPPERSMGDGALLLADNPPAGGVGNSDNHKSHHRPVGGQNVLRVGGDVRFQVERRHGDDDIYTNRHNRVGAGVDSSDSVLAPGDARP